MTHFHLHETNHLESEQVCDIAINWKAANVSAGLCFLIHGALGLSRTQELMVNLDMS